MSEVMEAFAAKRAQDETAYSLTPLRSWNGTPDEIAAMLNGYIPPPAPGVGNDDFALHLAAFLLEHGPPMLPHDLVYLGIYEDSNFMDECGGSVDEHGGASHFTWGCLTKAHLGPRRWTGFGLEEPEVFLVPLDGIVEHISYSGGRLSSADMRWAVQMIRGAFGQAFAIFEGLRSLNGAQPGMIDIEKQAAIIRQYVRKLRGLQREFIPGKWLTEGAILHTHRYLFIQAEARLTPPYWSPWAGHLFEDPRADPFDQADMMDGDRLSEYAFHLVSYLHRHGLPSPPHELEVAMTNVRKWDERKAASWTVPLNR